MNIFHPISRTRWRVHSLAGPEGSEQVIRASRSNYSVFHCVGAVGGAKILNRNPELNSTEFINQLYTIKQK
jgi:hypothetical protein